MKLFLLMEMLLKSHPWSYVPDLSLFRRVVVGRTPCFVGGVIFAPWVDFLFKRSVIIDQRERPTSKTICLHQLVWHGGRPSGLTAHCVTQKCSHGQNSCGKEIENTWERIKPPKGSIVNEKCFLSKSILPHIFQTWQHYFGSELQFKWEIKLF